jgi:hypothetical protein
MNSVGPMEIDGLRACCRSHITIACPNCGIPESPRSRHAAVSLEVA